MMHYVDQWSLLRLLCEGFWLSIERFILGKFDLSLGTRISRILSTSRYLGPRGLSQSTYPPQVIYSQFTYVFSYLP